MNIQDIINKKFNVKPNHLSPYTGLKPSRREDLYDLFAEVGFNYGAEVGVLRGANALQMFNRIPDLKLICVDPNQHERAIKRLKDKNAIWKVMTSMEAVKDIEDNSLDFVYIDGLHDFDNIMLDLIHWTPKVKAGGIVSGHDYFYSPTCQVPMAVDVYTRIHNYFKLHLTRDNIDGGDFPYSSSFFWVK